MVLQLAFVLVAIIIGARLGGIGLGVIFAGSSREATGHCGDCFAAGYNGKSHFGRRPHLAADSHRRHEGNARFRLSCRHAGGDCHIRHCLDGRYFSSGKHASVDPVHRGSGEANAGAAFHQDILRGDCPKTLGLLSF